MEERARLSRVSGEMQEAPREPEPVKPPFTTPGFDQVGATGPPAWKNWFEQNYPSIVRKFGVQPKEEKTPEGWSEFLQKERTRLKEEFASRSPYSRGERPGAFQPRIKTVAW